MATRSLVGKLNNDGTVRYIYVHYDGSLLYNGKILVDHYGANNIDDLLDLGDLCSLYFTLEECSPFEDSPAQVVASVEDYIKIDRGKEYTYLFKDNEWYYMKNNMDEFKLVAPEIYDELNTDDIQETQSVEYEVWIYSRNDDDSVTDFEFLVDGGYNSPVEAKKCYDFFSVARNLKLLNNFKVPEDVKHLFISVESVVHLDDDSVECLDTLHETEII